MSAVTFIATPAPAIECSDCHAPGTVRVIDAHGLLDMCPLHAMSLIGGAGPGERFTVFLDTADLTCPWCGAGSGHFPGCRGGR